MHPLSTAILLPGLASQIATSVLLDLPHSTFFVDPEVRDGLPSSAEIAKMTSGGGPVDDDGSAELATLESCCLFRGQENAEE